MTKTLFLDLPQEIQDKIFLLTDFKTIIINYKHLSDYIKKIVKYYKFTSSICRENDNTTTLLILKWLKHNKAAKINIYNILDIISKRYYYCSFDVFKWIINNNDEELNTEDKTRIVIWSARHDRLSAIQWLNNIKKFTIPEDIYYHAAYSTNIHMLEWLTEISNDSDKNFSKSSTVYLGALQRENNCKILDWLYTHDFPIDKHLVLHRCIFKMLTKCQKNMKWLHDHEITIYMYG